MRRIIAGVVLVLCGLVWSAANGGEILGLVVDAKGKPVVLSSVAITRTGGDSLVTLSGRTETDGAYRFLAVPPGEYDLTIRASLFYEATIRAVRLGEEVRIAPTIQLDFMSMIVCDVSNASRPLHYRLSNGT